MEDLIKTIPYFGGTAHEDVVQWLNIINEIFDRVELRPLNRYIAAQSFLTKTAALWFRYNRPTVSDWSSFQLEIIKTFQPTFSFRFISPLSITSQVSLQDLPGHVDSHEPVAVPVIEFSMDPAFESEIKPDPHTKPDDPNVNPDSAAEPDDTLTLGNNRQTVVDRGIREITKCSRFPSISSMHIRHLRCYGFISQKSSCSQTFLAGCHGDSSSVLFAGLVSFNTVNHQWRYKCNRMHGSCRVFQHTRYKTWPRLRKWKYRQ